MGLPEPANQKRIFRFGLYEFDEVSGELRKEGRSRPRLQGQPLEVLMHLLDRAGEVVTREELRQRLWPADTFVDYDHSLNTAVNKLRDALSDSADNPRFIQTIPRRGYRFIASVETLVDGAPNTTATETLAGPSDAPTAPSSSEARNSMLSNSEDLPRARRGVVQFLFSAIQVMYLGFYVFSLSDLHRVQLLLSEVVRRPVWPFALLLVTALCGIPVRLYLLSAAVFGYRGLPAKFLRLFPFVLPLDELWALAPFLLVQEIGAGLALAITAGLLYLPFSQRSLLLMGHRETRSKSQL